METLNYAPSYHQYLTRQASSAVAGFSANLVTSECLELDPTAAERDVIAGPSAARLCLPGVATVDDIHSCRSAVLAWVSVPGRGGELWVWYVSSRGSQASASSEVIHSGRQVRIGCGSPRAGLGDWRLLAMVKLRSGGGRRLAGTLVFVGLVALLYTIWLMVDRASWESEQGTVTDRIRSGRSVSVVVSYPGPNGTEEAKVSENGSAHQVGEQVEVRYQVENGRVTDVALDDSRQAHIVVIVLTGLFTLGALVLTVAARTPEATPREAPLDPDSR